MNSLQPGTPLSDCYQALTTTVRQATISCQPALDWATPTHATSIAHYFSLLDTITRTTMTIMYETIVADDAYNMYQTTEEPAEFSQVIKTIKC